MSSGVFEKKRNRTATCIALVVSMLGIAAVARGDHGLPHVELLARGAFMDDVGLTIRNKISGRATHVVQMSNASDQVVLRITIEPGGIAPWHNHTGTGFLVNTGPGIITNYIGDECIPREFYPGDAFVDPGHGDLHAVRNDSEEPVVLIATFLGVEAAPVTPEPGPSECDIF
jgi:quercetin dioxygenase-like cupin family protein